jgi:hypothetical protein
MKEDVDEMKAPWCIPEDMITDHIEYMDQGAVIACGVFAAEAGHMGRKYVGKELYIRDPSVSKDVLNIIENEIVDHGVCVDADG